MALPVAAWPASAAVPTLEWGPWPWLRDRAVDRLKRSALRRLHRTARGEADLLSLYLVAEEVGEASGLAEASRVPMPAWLRDQMQAHLRDEGRHVRILRQLATSRRGGIRRPDPLTRGKLEAMRLEVASASHRFTAGPCVAWVAMGLVLEEMGARFMSRHLQVLEGIADAGASTGAFRSALTGILADEERHVRGFELALRRLVGPGEERDAQELLGRLRSIDRRWSLTGSLGLWALAAVRGR